MMYKVYTYQYQSQIMVFVKFCKLDSCAQMRTIGDQWNVF